MDAKTEQHLKDFAQKSADESKSKSAAATATEEKKEEKVAEPEKKVEETKAEPVVEQKTEQPKKSIDELSDDELKEIVAKRGIIKEPAKQKSDEEVLTEVLQYGVQNNKLKLDEYNAAVKAREASDKDLVFQNFFDKLHKKNSKITREEAETKFQKKYAAKENVEEIRGDELDPDKVTDRKITYELDDDELKEEADKIRNNFWTPINKLKEEFTDVSRQKEFQETFTKETENLKRVLPNKVVFDLGDEKNPDPFEYTIDESFKPYIEQGVLDVYGYHKREVANGKAKDGSFNVNEAAKYAAITTSFKNIMKTYGASQYEAGKREALKDFKNPHTQTLETKEVSNAKSIPSDLEQIANLRRQGVFR